MLKMCVFSWCLKKNTLAIRKQQLIPSFRSYDRKCTENKTIWDRKSMNAIFWIVSHFSVVLLKTCSWFFAFHQIKNIMLIQMGWDEDSINFLQASDKNYVILDILFLIKAGRNKALVGNEIKVTISREKLLSERLSNKQGY